MTIREILESDSCNQIFIEVKQFTNESLAEYILSLRNGEISSAKDIFDFVWGTVNFSSAEMTILDSPLLQRLRHIRQLGLASTVYCNADSSRFSHTIGVTEVAGRMAKMVAKKVKDLKDHADLEIYACFDPIEVVRMAAIFHDTGHMFFSHVSEYFFSRNKDFPRYGEVTQATSYFCEKTLASASLHELLSVMIVNSPAVIEMLELISSSGCMKSRLNTVGKNNIDTLVELISCLIIGIPINKYILPYSMIINSAVDADRLDYLSRDSKCTRVPIAVDTDRIIQKLDVVNTESIVMSDIWNDSTSTAVPLKIMALKYSARNVFFQLSNARASMFESVYHHHKVLTAESMFRELLRDIYQNKRTENMSFYEILKLTDDSFNDFWQYSLLTDDERKDTGLLLINNMSQTLRWIRERRLFKRVAAISMDILDYKAFEIADDFLKTVVTNPTSKDSIEFCSDLRREYKKVCELFNKDDKENPDFLFVYSDYTQSDPIPIERGDGYCVWTSKLLKQGTIEAGKRSKQNMYYLVTNCKKRDFAYLALEKALFRYEKLKLKPEAHVCSKLKESDLNNLRTSLLEKDYYHDTLSILPDEVLLGKVYSKYLIDGIQRKYSSFLGMKNCKIDRQRILKYLRQFLRFDIFYNELRKLYNGLLKLINNAHYLDRDAFSTEIPKLFSGIDQKEKTICGVLLGGPYDSATHYGYFFNDVRDSVRLTFKHSVKEAFQFSDSITTLVFFDDGACTGNQVVGIFQQMMGIPVSETITEEDHKVDLEETERMRLRESEVVLCYLYFNEKSKKFIIDELNKLGIQDIKIHYNYDLSKKLFEDKVFSNDHEEIEIVKKYIGIAGREVLDSVKRDESGNYKRKWDANRISKNALGYEDSQQAVIFYNSVPTYTVTALWANGIVEGEEWEGLFQRTIKE